MADKPTQNDGDRIAKVIARAGLASRREAEAWIADGRVSVNGKPITSPALNVGPRDRISIDGQPLPRKARTRLFLYNKPRGLVTTHSDPEGRPTIFASLPRHLPRLISIGRLDMNTEGLLLLTNDGGLARALELPTTGWRRTYRVRALGRVLQPALDGLKKGVTVDGVHYGPIEATLDREQGANVWLTFTIREGKNREVRKVLESLGLKVNRLIRVSYGPFELGELDDAEVKEVETPALRKAIGPEIAKQAEADFDAPLETPAPLIPAKAGNQKDSRQGRTGVLPARGRAERGQAPSSFEDRRGRPQDDEERPKRKKPLHNKRRRPDRSSGPRPSRPRPK
ncbi:rRNA pseudouridine synthase [Microbacteriaceae bacterium K1510]|nr:rRNA pseudouridine synthase [Microbacteriaceae bacterium K1510]